MSTKRGIQITFDAADPHALAAWWADLLGYEVEDGHDLVSGLLEQGIVSEADVVHIDGRAQFAEAAAISGDGPRFLFQKVPESKTAKNRMHIDIPTDPNALDGEIERLVGLGATHLGDGQHPGHRWAIMADPEGNEFCLH